MEDILVLLVLTTLAGFIIWYLSKYKK